MQKWIKFIFFGLLWAHAAVAGAADTDIVKKVLVEGNARIESDAILRVVKTRPGEKYNPATLSQDLEAIYAMGYFDDVRVEEEKEADGYTVIFKVQERPTIREIDIEGNRVFDDEKIKENIDITSGSILNIYKINRNIKIFISGLCSFLRSINNFIRCIKECR